LPSLPVPCHSARAVLVMATMVVLAPYRLVLGCAPM
jgi:hypothetical protein